MKGNPTYSFPDINGKEKLKELILHITEKRLEEKNFGATKLNKILWLSDFYSYANFGIPITGVEYQKLRNGPAPQMLFPIRKQMEIDKDIKMKMQLIGFYDVHRIIPLRDPNYELFNSIEITFVDKVIDEIANNMNATQMSDLSHGIAWKIAKIGNPIPYESVFLSNDEINEYDTERTHELAKNLNWESI